MCYDPHDQRREEPVKRVLIAAGLLLMALGVVAPAVIGLIAAERHEELIERAIEREKPGPTMAVESFERGWFASEVRYRLEFRDERFQKVARQIYPASPPGAYPALVIDSTIHHGFFPGRSLTPVLARIDSTFVVEGLSEQPFQVPSTSEAVLYLDGSGVSVLQVAAHELEARDGDRFGWEAGELNVDFDSEWDNLSIDSNIGRITASDGGSSFMMGPTRLSAEQTWSDYGIWTGPMEIVIDRIEAGPTVQDPAVVEDVQITTRTQIDGDRFSGRTSLVISSVKVPGGPGGSGRLTVNLSGVDAGAVAGLAELANRVQSSGTDGDMTGFESDATALLETLARRGGTLELEDLSVDTSEGAFEMDARINLPENAIQDIESPSAWLLALRGNASIKIDQNLLALGAVANPQFPQYLEAMITAGYLVQEGNRYMLEALYQGGLLTVNGNPLPMPIQ